MAKKDETNKNIHKALTIQKDIDKPKEIDYTKEELIEVIQKLQREKRIKERNIL